MDVQFFQFFVEVYLIKLRQALESAINANERVEIRGSWYILRTADRSAFRKVEAMTSVTLSSKFQLSIPKAIREEMHLKAGQKFAIIPKGDTIVLAPIRSLDEMRGILSGADTSNYRDRTDRLERYE